MKALLFLLLLFSLACGHRPFRVLPGESDYLLRAPDAKATPFRDILTHYNGYAFGEGWLDLHTRMQLSVENAYYQEGVPKRGINGYLGTEVAHYRIESNGELRLLNVSSMPQRPKDQPPVQELVDAAQQRQPYHRLFSEVLFKDRATGSILLSAKSAVELDQLATQLRAAPESVCGAQSAHCAVFPEACTVLPEVEIEVNGAPRVVFWGSNLASIAPHPRELALSRLYSGHSRPVQLDPADPKALRLPLLPGDQIIWN